MNNPKPRQNIFEMYVANGNKAGFWIKRNSWSANIARVTSIANQAEGPLEGNPPYFKSQKVKGDVYIERSGDMRWASGGSGRQQDITSAGTYGYELVDTPHWWKES